jgi:hypothetical protein
MNRLEGISYTCRSCQNVQCFLLNGSTAIVGPGRIFGLLIYLQSVGLLGRVIGSSQGLYPKHKTAQKQNKHIHTPNIHDLSGIRTHDHSIRVSKDSSCLRPLSYHNRRCPVLVEAKHQTNFKDTTVLAMMISYPDHFQKLAIVIRLYHDNSDRDTGFTLNCSWSPAQM